MPSRTFWIALTVSLAVHAALLSGLPHLRSDEVRDIPPLTAELQRLTPPPPPAPKPRPAAAPARKPPPPPIASPAPAPAPPDPPTSRIPDPPPAPAPMTEPVAAADPVPEVAEAPEVPAAQPAAQAPAWEVVPSSGTITYELFYGGGGIGRSVQTWRVDRATYRLTSVSEPVGLVAVFLPYQYAYTSEGKIGPDGLQPEAFTARSGRRGARQSSATLDWVRQEITFGAAGSARKQALPPGTQDLLSFVYQIALAPAVEPGRRQMIITQGNKIDTYLLEIGPEEAIDLPVGPMRAIPVRRIVSPGEEGMRLWLASTPPRLPVRIQFFDRAGKMTIEQLASKIELNGG